MTGAVLDSALAEIMMVADELVLVEATFGTKDRQINGTFVAMPGPALLTDLMRSWGKE
jgi:chemotaxis protein CheY-P-specific phosphatase CheC